VVAKVDDVEVVQKHLEKDFVINSMLSSVAGNMALCCGRMLVDANATLITARHIDFEKEPAKEPSKEAHIEPYKGFPLLYTELRNWIHLLLHLPMCLKFQNLTKSLQKNPGRGNSGKMLPIWNCLAREATKRTKKSPKSLLRKKRSQRTQVAESTAIWYLTLKAWLSPA